MILHDVQAILGDDPVRHLKPADPAMVSGLVAAQRQLNGMPNT